LNGRGFRERVTRDKATSIAGGFDEIVLGDILAEGISNEFTCLILRILI
jgi:hypothetical protein